MDTTDGTQPHAFQDSPTPPPPAPNGAGEHADLPVAEPEAPRARRAKKAKPVRKARKQRAPKLAEPEQAEVDEATEAIGRAAAETAEQENWAAAAEPAPPKPAADPIIAREQRVFERANALRMAMDYHLPGRNADADVIATAKAFDEFLHAA